MIETIGRYEILDKIGEGGFAIVYRARDTELDRPVALKELRPVLLTDKDWVKRFRREAKTIAHLDHAHIVTIYDVYEIDGRLFIVMRLVNGPSLDELIATQQRLPWPQAIDIITTVAQGLDHAHARGILHRDLKPANILMDPERGPMLTDFGLAKLASESSMSMTASGGVVGTPHYIAPEVWEGHGATKQSDIYALGCILFEMLTGEKIFKGETPPAVMMAHFKPPVLPQLWPAGVPAGVADVLKTALASKPSGRYATVGEMAQALATLTALPGVDLKPNQLEAVEVATDIGDRPLPDPDLAQPHPQTVSTPLAAEIPSEPPQTQAASPVKVKLQQLEDAIADLPPKWHSYLKSFSMVVIIVFILGMVNLFTSTYPWFIWIALAAGAFLAFRFVNLLFGSKKEPVTSPPAGVQSTTPSPAPSPVATPVLGQESPAPPAPEATATTPSAGGPTPSQVVRAREQRKRSGCLWIGIALAGIFLITIIGLGGFCTVFGTFLGSAMPTVELGSTLTETINVPVPDASETPDLSLMVRGGQFSLAPGAKQGLVEGTVTYNVSQLKPQIDIDGSNIHIFPEKELGFGAFATENLENTWDLKLGPMPMELTIDVGGTNSEIELGTLALTDLAITQGLGDFQLSFSQPNQIEMGNLKFKGGASSSKLTGLANARVRDISFEGGAGEFTLDFSGELQNDMEVDVSGGVGEIRIIVPKGVAAQVSSSGAMSGVEMMGDWQKSDDTTYVLPGEGHKITIKADIGLGNLKLLTAED